jgi:ABC-type transporter Mla subunit MlaD
MDIKTERQKLTQAFSNMAEQVNLAVHNAEELISPTIDDMVDNAKALTKEIYQLTQEEASFLGEAMKLELDNASEALSEQKEELRGWLDFDLLLVEQQFYDLLEKTADKSWLDFK